MTQQTDQAGRTTGDVLAGRAEWVVVTGDCRDAMAALGVSSVDAVVTDPPYDAATHAGARTNRTLPGHIHTPGNKIAIDFDPIDPIEIVPMLLPASRGWVVAFCALEQLGAYKLAAGAQWVRAGVWDRINGCPQLSGDRPAQGAEGIAIMHRVGVKRWGGGGKRAVWVCGVERNARVHPTQKPLRLLHDLVYDFTDPCDVVLDPFCGSGTTGEACLRLHRRFIGIERNAAYADAARERLAVVEETLRAERGEHIAVSKPRQIGLFK